MTEAIDLVVSLPENLPEVKEGYNRTYYIVRQHNDDIELLDTSLTEDGKGLTFKSDKFSTYAIAYIDTKIEANPNTADINLMTLIGMILVGLVGIIYTMKNRLFN